MEIFESSDLMCLERESNSQPANKYSFAVLFFKFFGIYFLVFVLINCNGPKHCDENSWMSLILLIFLKKINLFWCPTNNILLDLRRYLQKIVNALMQKLEELVSFCELLEMNTIISMIVLTHQTEMTIKVLKNASNPAFIRIMKHLIVQHRTHTFYVFTSRFLLNFSRGQTFCVWEHSTAFSRQQ